MILNIYLIFSLKIFQSKKKCRTILSLSSERKIFNQDLIYLFVLSQKYLIIKMIFRSETRPVIWKYNSHIMIHDSNFEYYSQNLGSGLSLASSLFLVEHDEKGLLTVLILTGYSILLDYLRLRQTNVILRSQA